MAIKRWHLTLVFIVTAMVLSSVNASTTFERLAQCLPPVSCPGYYDVVVMLDRSRKVKDETFTGFIELIKKLVPLFDIKEDGNHFGLVLYNDNPQVRMKLNENNNITFIENYLWTDLPGREGDRNLRRALRETRQQLLTQAMGDRPNATNVCLLLTTEEEETIRSNKQYPKIHSQQVCDKFVVLRKGRYSDLERVQHEVCPTPSVNEARNRTSSFCRELLPCNCTDMPSCPLPYTAVGAYCFHFVFRRQNFLKGVEECQKRNGSLITIDTEEKNEALTLYSTTLQLDYTQVLGFIGLRNEAGDNQDHRWISDNSTLTFSNWFNGQPNPEDSCVMAVVSTVPSPPTGAWFSTGCDSPFGAICETDQLALG